MAAGPDLEDVIAALESSGYLMEQEVATALEALGFHVTTNRAFEDTDEHKSREMDVSAIRRFVHNESSKLAAFVEIIAECKKSSNPFVFIGRPKNKADERRVPEEIKFPISSYYRSDPEMPGRLQTVEPFEHLEFDRVHFASISDTKAVQFCRIDRKGSGWHANHGGLYDAIFYPMAKAVTARRSELPKNRDIDEWKYFWLTFPLVVVNGPLLYVDSAKSPPEPREVNFVTFQRELKSAKLSGHYSITFVRQDSLEEFVAGPIQELMNHTENLVVNHPERVLKKTL